MGPFDAVTSELPIWPGVAPQSTDKPGELVPVVVLVAADRVGDRAGARPVPRVARRAVEDRLGLLEVPGERAAIVRPEHGPVGVGTRSTCSACAASAVLFAQNVARQPGGSGREGNVCQPQVIVRGAVTSVGISKKLTRSIDLAVLAADFLRGQRLVGIVVPALVVIGEPEEGPVGVRSARCTARNRRPTCRRRSTGWSSGRAARRGPRPSRRPWCRSASPASAGRAISRNSLSTLAGALAGRRNVEIDLHEAVELDAGSCRELQSGRLGRAAEVGFGLDAAIHRRLAGLDLDLLAVLHGHQPHGRGQLGHAAVGHLSGQAQAVERQPSGSTRRPRRRLTCTGVQGGITLSRDADRVVHPLGRVAHQFQFLGGRASVPCRPCPSR